MKKVLEVFKKPLWLLCLGLGIVLFASIFANMTNTSAYQVSVTEVKFKTERNNGEMVGLLYKPKSCTKENPCPTIVTTHGYLNSKEMQDAPAIELSRRGFVVLAMDMYDHGDSTWETPGAFQFWYRSQYDAVQWAYKQDYVLKAPDGTGMIAVSGHSMGGFSSRMATYYDSLDVAAGQPQKIAALLAVGADYTHINARIAERADIINYDVAQKRTVGTIAGHYDEFFFNPDNNQGGTVKEKDWTKTTIGAQFYYGDMSVTSATAKPFESGEWNTTSYGGAGSVIYVPNEIHPWNHISVESTGYMVDFYTTAFKTQFDLHNVTAKNALDVVKNTGKGQTWWLKEALEFIALFGMFMTIGAAVGVFAALPFFSKVTTAETEINEVRRPKGLRKVFGITLLVFSVFSTAYIYPMIESGTTENFVSALYGLMWASAIVLLAAGIASFIIKAVKGEDEKASKVITDVVVGAVAVFATSFLGWWVLNRNFFTNGNFYNEPGTNPIAYWVLGSGSLTLVALAIGYAINNRKDGYTCANYGLKANWKQILIALLTAVIVVGGVYAITFAIEALLRVDFRLWTYAIKPFSWNHFLAFLKYLPAFLFFYIVNGISIIANTGHDKTWKGTLKAVLINCLGLVILLGVHYGMDFVTGTAKYPGLALNIILVWAIVPTLALAAWITRKSYQRTGNIWTGVFINALLFTLMQVANTTLYLLG